MTDNTAPTCVEGLAEPEEQELAILFADICDSVPIYERFEPAVALSLIAQCLDALADTALDHGGVVVRSKGDDVLCTFANPASALDAAAEMVDMHGPGTTAIHVGINYGTAMPAREDIYGDAVNVAARMLALAKPGEIIASAALFDALPEDRRDQLVLLGQRTLKGKRLPVEVYSMVLDEGVKTQMAWDPSQRSGVTAPPTVRAALVAELEFQGQVFTIRDGQRFVLGRAPRCDLVIHEACVSREHAWLEVTSGRATFSDRSSTGSWIIDPDGSHTTLRRESVALGLTGRIRLGVHPRDLSDAPEIAFRLRQVV